MPSISGSICDAANSCQQIILNVSSDSLTFDYVYLSKVWGLAFASVLSLYLFSLGLGQIIRLVKHA